MNNKSFLQFSMIALCLALSFLSVSYANKDDDAIISIIKVSRTGDFLKEPGNNPIEILRRSGRIINKKWPVKDDAFSVGYFLSSEKNMGYSTVFDSSMKKEQSEMAKDLFDKYMKEIHSMVKEDKKEKAGISVYGILNSSNLLLALKNILADPEKVKKLSDRQKANLDKQIIPVLKMSDYCLANAYLSEKGLVAKFKLNIDRSRLNDVQKLALISSPVTIGKFVNPNSILSICQKHNNYDEGVAIKELRKIPQTKVIENYLASAGLSLEKDILTHSANEVIITLNLEPSGEANTPDIRIVAPVRNYDEKEFNVLLSKLKTICSQLGIFVKVLKEDPNIVRFSYFLFPQFALYGSQIENMIAIATGKNNLKDEINHISKILKGQSNGIKISKNCQLYLRATFSDFNRQFQMFLQSPLLRNRGIPPLSNLTSLDDLGVSEFMVSSDKSSVSIELLMPIKKKN